MTRASAITVVIPTYNRSAELERALDSLVRQTDPDFAVFVCDDGSAEDIRAVVARYEDRLTVACERIDNSGGPARPRNVGVQYATSEWVAFLDSDDWWDAGRIAAVKAVLGDDVDVLYHPLRIARAKASQAGGREPAVVGLPLRDADPLVHMLRFGNPLATSATVVRTALMREIGGFDERRELSSVEDFDAWLRLAARGARFRFLAPALGDYWVGEDNISAFTPRQYERQRALFERQLDLLPGRYRRLARSNFNYLLGSYELALGLPDSGRLRAVELSVEPARWLKARVKQVRRALARPARSA